MKLRLKEEPKEWVKFTAVMAFIAALVVYGLLHRKVVEWSGAVAAWCALILMLLTSALKPRLFRRFYRAGMTVSFHVGQVIGGLLLMVIFIVFVTPLGLALRLIGKDLLAVRSRPLESYWSKPKPPGPFDRQF
jgi:hypothetical protein